MIPSVIRALVAAAILVALVATAASLLGCSAPAVEYRQIPGALIPPKPALPTVKADELRCLADDVYARLAARDRALQGHIAELRALLGGD